MSKYEIMVIIRADIDEAKQKEITSKLEGFITSNGCTISKTDVWGKRDLQSMIDKATQGYYVVIFYEGKGAAAHAAIENYIQVTEDVLRHMIIKHEKDYPKLAVRKERVKEAA